MVLYWGGGGRRTSTCTRCAEQWAREHANFRYVPVMSEARPEDAWTGRTGFVHHAVMEDFPDLSGHQVYACGVPIMVESAQRGLHRQQCELPEDEFFADSFTTAGGPRRRAKSSRSGSALAEVGRAHLRVVQQRRSRRRASVISPDSIT